MGSAGLTGVVTDRRHDHIVVVHISRPEKRNAIDGDVTLGLDAALNEFEDDPGLWVAVITGDGGCFSAGTDLRRTAGAPTERGGEYGIIRRERSKPIIAAVEGVALGGGMEIVLACDLVVAARTAAFGLPEARRGLVPTCGGLFRTPRALPLNVAKEILLTGEPIGAERAYGLGFVNQVTEPGGALAAAVALAARVCQNSPASLSETLTALNRTVTSDDAEGWAATADALDGITGQPDADEGVRAFFERRTPRWGGAG